MRAVLHVHLHLRLHSRSHLLQTNIHICILPYMHPYTHTFVHTYMHIPQCIPTYIHELRGFPLVCCAILHSVRARVWIGGHMTQWASSILHMHIHTHPHPCIPMVDCHQQTSSSPRVKTVPTRTLFFKLHRSKLASRTMVDICIRCMVFDWCYHMNSMRSHSCISVQCWCVCRVSSSFRSCALQGCTALERMRCI